MISGALQSTGRSRSTGKKAGTVHVHVRQFSTQSFYHVDILRRWEVEKVEPAKPTANSYSLIAPLRSTPKTSKLLVITMFSTRMTS